MICPGCGHENPAVARFCAKCGSALSAESPAADPAAPSSDFAGFWIRLVAWIIDSLVVGFALQFITFFNPSFGTLLLLWVVGPWVYYVTLTGIRGQTLGKMALGLMVIREDGSLPGLGYAALREIIGKFVSGLLFGLGFFSAGWDKRKQGWRDKIAGTVVIRTRS